MFEELKLKRRFFRKPKEVYDRDIKRSISVAKEVENKNPDFSETFFDTWVQTIFLRYATLVSTENKMELDAFEKIHVKDGAKNNWRDEIELYKFFDEVRVNFVDYIEYIHTDSNDVLNLKISITSFLKDKRDTTSEIKEQISSIYSIELEKKNVETQTKTTMYTSNCPNCGGPNTFVTFGICRYCGDLICIYDNEWKIRRINLER